ncbi:helix-turn-helix domain containing protein [Phaeobacter sp. PT47_59]|uniref:TetR/AcrR family transcriptional regulator n=1 Tax=Phaeobacter sp. PT47_59 TaxID=3029979 RepID=UPI002380588B|nr:TetR/AcrR family transcriptional regulator [Phaeobacter sp. PT47_59]MDE4173969.1 helix-turn-helix domain containing protein [Phaeobacter sp. PT47_59]
MNQLSPDPKAETILHSAWQAFSAYGFRKTSMDDIARGAGMSRPAVYLHFRNKEAIFTALVEAYYTQALHDVQAALDQRGTLAERLSLAFEAHGGPTMEAMMSSAHGLELFEASMSVAPEAIQAGEAALAGLYAAWLAQRELPATVGPAEEVAQVFCSALKGIKHTSADYAGYRQRVLQLAALMARALQGT